MVRAQRGDVEAYSTLTAGRVDRLYSTARLIVGNDDRAADAVQDALLNAWLDLRALRDPDRFDAWLRRVLVRTCYAAAKRHRVRTVTEVDLSSIGEPTTADSQIAIGTHDQLDRAFSRLSTDHRAVVVLVHYLGLSLAEAADALGVPLGTVQSRLSRATQAMRGVLEADERLMTAESSVA